MSSALDVASDLLSKLPGFVANHRDMLRDVVSHLVRFGYLDDKQMAIVGSSGEISHMVNEAFHRLSKHAGFDPEMGGLDLLVGLYKFVHRNPRCAISEAEAATAKWNKKNLTYWVEKAPRGLTAQQMMDLAGQYFHNWEVVCDIKFSPATSASSDILISTGRGSATNFDGAGGTLAWAYLPNGSDRQLLMRFDDDETFTTNQTGNGIYLEAVSTHEFGHLIGLSHAPTSGFLMSPYYSRDVFKPRSWDIEQAVGRYGFPAVQPPAPTPTPPTPPQIPSNYVDANGIVIPGYRLVKVG